MSNDSGSTGGVVSGKLPADTFQEFEEFRDERDLTKSDAVRRLVALGLESESEQEAGPEEVESGGESSGILSQILPSSASAFLAAAVILLSLNRVTSALVSLAASGISFVILERSLLLSGENKTASPLPSTKEGTDSPLAARKILLKGYLTLSVAGIMFAVLMYADRIVYAGLVEIAGFLLAGWLVFRHLSYDEISEFSEAQLRDIAFIVVGAVVVVTNFVIAIPMTVVGLFGVLIIWGYFGVAVSTVELLWEIAPVQLEVETEEAAFE